MRIDDLMVRQRAIGDFDEEVMGEVCCNALLLEGTEQPRLIEEAIPPERRVIILMRVGQKLQGSIGVDLRRHSIVRERIEESPIGKSRTVKYVLQLRTAERAYIIICVIGVQPQKLPLGVLLAGTGEISETEPILNRKEDDAILLQKGFCLFHEADGGVLRLNKTACVLHNADDNDIVKRLVELHIIKIREDNFNIVPLLVARSNHICTRLRHLNGCHGVHPPCKKPRQRTDTGTDFETGGVLLEGVP